MNINVLIDQLKKRIGLNGMLSGIYSDTMLKDIILNDSLVTFSRYNQFYIQVSMDELFNRWPQKRRDNGNSSDIEVMIPDAFLEDLKSLGSEVVNVSITRRTVYPLNGVVWSRGMKDDLSFLAAGQLVRNNNSEPKITWRSPNTILLRDFYSSVGYVTPLAYNLRIKCTHPRNLSTITKGVEEIFSELCYADIIMNLYNNDFKLMSVSTGSAQIDLNSEPFASASSIREEVLQKIRRRASYDNLVLQM